MSEIGSTPSAFALGEVQTYTPSKRGVLYRKAEEQKRAANLFKPFWSETFGASIGPGDSCIRSADEEELDLLFRELHCYRVKLEDGCRKLLKLWKAANGIEDSIRAAKAERKNKKIAGKKQATAQMEAALKRELKAAAHSQHQEKLTRFEYLKRKAFYELVVSDIGRERFDELMNQAISATVAEAAPE